MIALAREPERARTQKKEAAFRRPSSLGRKRPRRACAGNRAAQPQINFAPHQMQELSFREVSKSSHCCQKHTVYEWRAENGLCLSARFSDKQIIICNEIVARRFRAGSPNRGSKNGPLRKGATQFVRRWARGSARRAEKDSDYETASVERATKCVPLSFLTCISTDFFPSALAVSNAEATSEGCETGLPPTAMMTSPV